MRPNILLPTSAKAPNANESSPRYTTKKGKQDSPGAKEGISALKKYLVTRSIIRLNKSARAGNISKELSNLILRRATKITAGKATLKMIVLTPFKSCLANFFCNSRPKLIINNSSIVL